MSSSSLSSEALTFKYSGKNIIKQTAVEPNILEFSTSYTGTTLSTALGTRVFVDSNSNIYMTGVYNSLTPIQVNNLNGTLSSIELPATTDYDNFLIKYSKNGNVLAYSCLGNTASYLYSTVLFDTNSFYWSGSFKSTTSVDVYTLDSNHSVGLTIQAPTSSSVYNTFIIKFNYDGTPTEYSCLNGTGDTIPLCMYINNDSLYVLGYYTGQFSVPNFTSTTLNDVIQMEETSEENGFVIKYIGSNFDSVSLYNTNNSTDSSCRPTSIAFTNKGFFVCGYYKGELTINSIVSDETLELETVVNNTMFVIYYPNDTTDLKYITLDSESLGINLLYNGDYLYVYGLYNDQSSIYNFDGTLSNVQLLEPNGTFNPFILKYGPNFILDSIVTIPTSTSTVNSMSVSSNSKIYINGQYTNSSTVPLYDFYNGSTVPSASFTLPSATNSNQFLVSYENSGSVFNYLNETATSGSLSVDVLDNVYITSIYSNGSLLKMYDSEGTIKKFYPVLSGISNPVDNQDVSNKKYSDFKISLIKGQTGFLNTNPRTINILNPYNISVQGSNSPTVSGLIPVCSCSDNLGNTYISGYITNNCEPDIYNNDGSYYGKINSDTSSIYTVLLKYNSNGIVLGHTLLKGCYPSELHTDVSNNVYLSGYSDYGLLYPISIYNIDSGQSSQVETIQGGSIYFIVKWSSEGYYVDNVSQFSNYDIKDINNFASNSFTVSSNGSTLYQTINNSVTNLNNFISLENAGYYNTSIFSSIGYPSQTIVSASVRYLNGFVSMYDDTMAIGIPQDSGGVGATWIYVRGTDGIWTQQGSKLVGSSSSTISLQGQGVSLYKDTLAVGGYNTTSGIPSLWMFQRIGTVWSQIGSKLAPSDAVGGSIVTWQTTVVSIYENTLALGSPYDNNNRGAAWLYKKNTSGEWSQATSKIISPTPITRGYFSTVSLGRNTLSVGEGGNGGGYKGKTFIYDVNGTSVSLAFTGSSTDVIGLAIEGNATSVSEDGNYVVSGAPKNNSDIGCSIVYYKNSSGQWSQQGPLLVGTGGSGATNHQGHHVCITRDSSYFAAYAYSDDSTQGAIWMFTRSGTVWTQYGSKLVSPGVEASGKTSCCANKNYVAFVNSDSATSTGSVSVYDLNRSGLVKYKNGLVEGFSPIIGAKLTSTIVDGQDNVYCTAYTSGSTFSLYNIRNSEDTGYYMKETNGGTSVIKWTSDGLYEANSFIKGSYETKLVTDKQNNLYCTGLYSSNEQVPVYDLVHLQYPNKEYKLIGTGGTGTQGQGYSISLSSDGSTLAVGGYFDNSSLGAVWIFTRSGAVWTQQGSKLVGTGGTGTQQQGYSVSLSSDGSTLAVGGYTDNSNIGATWIYTRSGTVWTQQGSKLVGTGGTGNQLQGVSVSLSSDGSILAVGGQSDNTSVGATWIFTRSGTVWSQQGSKLVGTGGTSAQRQGSSISLSSDGSILAVGGQSDNTNVGATWIFTRSGTVWTQQGSKLVGTGGTGSQSQGYSVSLSSDGSTLAVGGYNDDSSVGATWIFTRSGTVWTQEGSKLVGTGGTGNQRQGQSVSLASDGSILAVGGYLDNTSVGATWIFTRSGTVWTQYGSKLIGSGGIGQQGQGSSVSFSSSGSILAVGGYVDNTLVGATWIFYPFSTYTQQLGLYLPQSYGLSPIYNQISSKLVGTGGTGTQLQGRSVSLSSDGSIMAIGGSDDNSSVGATWIFTRSGTVWTQQGSKLVGTGGTGLQGQGQSVSLSSDGSTLAVGGYGDNSNVGAVWIFTRSGTVWTQQGSKLVGTGNTGLSQQGSIVSLSSDGSILAVGGYGDNTNVGATWIFTRSGTVWTQQGSKLVGTGNTGSSQQGQSVSLTSDGSILAVGGYGDNSSVGATWIFTRSGTVWTQQGSKLVGTGSTGTSWQGYSVLLSSDGSTLAIGGISDNSSTGATWIFTRSGTVWTQQGSKLVGTGGTGTQYQGYSTSLSSDGSILAVGGYNDNSSIGATWIFTRSGTVWTQQGSKLLGTGNTGSSQQGSSVSLSSDGSILAIGGFADNSFVGAVWTFINNEPSTSFVIKWSPNGTAQSVLSVPSSLKNSASIDNFGNFYLSNVNIPNQNISIQNFRNTNDENYSQFILEENLNSNTWITTGSMNISRQNHCINLLNNGKVLVVGGQTNNNASSATSIAEIYDPDIESWTTIGSLSVARFNSASTILNDGRILVAGGTSTSGTVSLSNCDLYDPDSNIWTTTGSMLMTRSSFSLVCLRNNFVLAAGGSTNSPTSVTELYNPYTGVWTTTGSTLVGHSAPIGNLLPNGNVLLVSGTNTPVCEIYNVNTGTWSLTDSLPNNTYLTQYTNFPGYFVVNGGSSTGTFSYDYNSNIWKTSMPTPEGSPIRSGQMTMLPNGNLFLYGGTVDNQNATSNSYVYNNQYNQWIYKSSMNFKRFNFKSVLLNNGNVLATGGCTGSQGTSINICELYYPDKNILSIIKYNSSGTAEELTTINDVYFDNNLYNNTISFDKENNVNLVSSIGSKTSVYNFGKTTTSLFTINPICPDTILPVSTGYIKWNNDNSLKQGRKNYIVNLPETENKVINVVTKNNNFDYILNANGEQINFSETMYIDQ